MRILHVVPSLAESYGGPGVAVSIMGSGLSRQGMQVEIAAVLAKGEIPVASLSLPSTGVSDTDVVRHYFPVSTGRYRTSWQFMRWMTRSAKDYDVVHVHGLFNFTSVVAAWAARRARVPYVIRPFGVLAEYGLRHRRPRLKRASIRFVEGPLLSDAAAVHFTSEQEYQQAIPLGIPWRSVVIPLGVPMLPLGDRERLIRTLPGDPMTCRIVSLSRLHPQKNLESLLVALRLLRSDGLRPSLLVAGTGEAAYVTALRELAIEQGVDDQVHWLGHVTGRAKADLLAAADLFALTSFSESYGLAAAEALAAGVPCIVSQGVALAALIRESRAGVVVEPDPASIASGIRTLLHSPERLQASAAAAGRVANAELSVRLMSERLIKLYRSLVAA